ncbi:hypothetical protein GCM10023189_33070 [Nibrella saemangeumensis]|uniref:Uncharacterized protein n=1 Tax=Nibrella saemangeumensis TaxID=1084526 RepID=A0ABP8N2M9_9BACT
MNYRDTEKLVIKAIDQKRVLKIRQKGSDFDIELEPYIEGNDFLQQKFVWGYIPFNQVYYKFYFEFAERIKITDKTFTPPENIHYYFSDEEEHFGSLESIHRWQNFGKHE